jgi:hypothetical protein
VKTKISSERGEGEASLILSATPISVRVPQAIAMTGFSRSRLYELIKSGELIIAKDGNCTFVLVDSLKAAIERRVVHR